MNAPLTAEIVLGRLAELPALPAAVAGILAALKDETESAEHVVHSLNADPVLVARVLGAANMAAAGGGRRIGSLVEAITRLGFDRVRILVLMTALVRQVNTASCGFDPTAYWRHSVAVAICSRVLAREVAADEELAFNVGLLHDIGHLFIVIAYPQEFEAIREFGRERDTDIVVAERAVLGVDHGAIGSMMAAHWRLPTAFSEAIAGHHNPDGSGNECFGDIVHVAEVLAYALDLGTVARSVVPALSPRACADLGVSWPALGRRFGEIEARYRAACLDFGF